MRKVLDKHFSDLCFETLAHRIESLVGGRSVFAVRGLEFYLRYRQRFKNGMKEAR